MSRTRSLAAVLVAGALAALNVPASAQETSNAERLADLMFVGPMMDQMLGSMEGPLASQMEAQFPGRGDEAAAIFVEEYQVAWDRHAPQIRDQTVAMMMRHFTEEEIGEILAFYETPVGRKTIETMPALMADTMEIMLPLTNEIATTVTPRVMERMTAGRK